MKDPPASSPSIPGILGMNVIRRCYRELFGAFGPSLFDIPEVAQAPGPVVEALQKCHQAAVNEPITIGGAVKVRGPRAV